MRPPGQTDPVLLTISTTHVPATDLGYLLHKHPDRVQEFRQSFGAARVLYPEATEETFQAFRRAMFGGEFVFSVSRQFVGDCPVPLLILPGSDHFHPRAVAMEIAELAPNAEVFENWAGEDRKPATRERIRLLARPYSGLGRG